MKWTGPEKGLQERRGRGGHSREGFKEERAGLKRGSREGQGGAQVTRGWGREAEQAAVKSRSHTGRSRKKCPEEGGAREEKPWEGGAGGGQNNAEGGLRRRSSMEDGAGEGHSEEGGTDEGRGVSRGRAEAPRAEALSPGPTQSRPAAPSR